MFSGSGAKQSARQALALALVFGALGFGGEIARGQTPPGTAPPTEPPPTGLQAPLPKPSQEPPPPNKPATVSPNLRDVAGHTELQPLTLQGSVAIALYTNRSLALAEEALLKAQGRTAESRAAFNPSLGLTFTYTRLDQGQSITFGNQTIVITNPDQRQIGLSASLPIDISGILKASLDQSKLNEVVARLDVNRTRNQIVYDVKSAFYQALRNQKLLDVAQEALADTQLRLDDARRRLNAGVVAPFDVQRATADVFNAQQQVQNAQFTLSTSLTALKLTIGLNINTPLKITSEGAVELPTGMTPPAENPQLPKEQVNPGPAPQPDTTQPPLTTTITVTDPLPPLPGYDGLLKEALSTRPEILEGDAGIAAARKGLLIARRSQLPSLAVSISSQYLPDATGFSPRTTLSSAVVSLSVPLFDQGVGRARETQARADIATAETNRRQNVDSVTNEVLIAYQSLQVAEYNMVAAKQEVETERIAFNLARIRYNAGVTAQAGVSPLLELSDAQNRLTQAESNYVNALYNYNSGRSQLDKAIGRYAFVFNGGKRPEFEGYPAPPPPKTLGNPATGVPK